MRRLTEVICTECKGTGSTRPDCDLCEGYRSVLARRAYAKGWKKHELPEIEYDGYCECPQCYDEATSCMFCYGDGTTSPEIEAQQRMRVLVQARHGFIPLIFRTDYRGNFIRDEAMYLLSSRAAADAREEGLLHWYCSVFGDELHLTPKGRDAAKDAWREYRALCRKWIAAERERRSQLAAYRAASGRRAIEGGERHD